METAHNDPHHLQDDIIAMQERYAKLKFELAELLQGKSISGSFPSAKVRKYQSFFTVNKNKNSFCSRDFTFETELYRQAMLYCS